MFTVEKNATFNSSLLLILKYIAKDSPTNARKFKTQLDKKIKNIPNMPFKARKSLHIDDEHTRDLIFKGYTIPYYIDEIHSIIIILDIFKWQDK